MLDSFDVGVVYPLRTYERHQFCLSIDGKEYRGDYYDDIIHWLHPHPKQIVNKEELNKVEVEVYEMLGHHGIRDDMGNIEVERMLNKSHQQADAHRFKIEIQGKEYKGVWRDEAINWYHPDPNNRLKQSEMGRLEKKVHQKVEKQRLDND